jgi:hypothetical protein
MSDQLGIDGEVQPERLCACGRPGCSLEGKRADAIWRSRACAVRWARENPGKSLTWAYSANKGRTRSRRTRGERGVQVSLPKAIIVVSAISDAPEAEIRRVLTDALSPAQQRILEQRKRAA